MSGLNPVTKTIGAAKATELAWSAARKQRPSFQWSDIWRAPLHDFPIRDEILYQFLPLSPEMDVLEIGPGSGFTAFRLARHVRHLTLLDIAKGAIQTLKDGLGGIPNLKFVCADVCAPELPNVLAGRFDAVFGLAVLDLLPDSGTCLKNLGALLRPGGSLLLQFPNYPPPRGRGVTYFRNRDELDRLMEAAAFESWEIFALSLRPYPGLIYRSLYDAPLRAFRKLRRGYMEQRPLSYDCTWTFQRGGRLSRYRWFVHSAWGFLTLVTRLGGECFELRALDGEVLNHNLLLLGRR
jgi:SAM-dependent methyltransferase